MEHNKLVRDNIPKIIENNGEQSITRILSDEEYKEELFKKLLEESNEVITSSSDTLMEELGDVLEVMIALAKTKDKSLEDIIEIANKKRIKRGGFEKKIYLLKTYKK